MQVQVLVLSRERAANRPAQWPDLLSGPMHIYAETRTAVRRRMATIGRRRRRENERLQTRRGGETVAASNWPGHWCVAMPCPADWPDLLSGPTCGAVRGLGVAAAIDGAIH